MMTQQKNLHTKATTKSNSSTRGLSRIELICLLFIICVLLVLLFTGITWYRTQQLKAEDSMLQNTAESVAASNIVTGSCPVRGCDGGGECAHRTADGVYVGYFSHPLNTIGGDLSKGYNSYKVMTAGGRTYRGEPGTMVIKVEVKDGDITLSWVKGR